jgi:hypothetical protein
MQLILPQIVSESIDQYDLIFNRSNESVPDTRCDESFIITKNEH